MTAPEWATKAQQIRSTPEFKTLREKLTRITARGYPAIVLSEKPLPAGAEAIVRLGQAGPLPRYAVVSHADLNDELVMRVWSLALAYEQANEDDDSPVEIVVGHDGMIESHSTKLGRSKHQWTGSSHVNDRMHQTPIELAKLSSQPQEEVPGFGRAQVIRDWGKPQAP